MISQSTKHKIFRIKHILLVCLCLSTTPLLYHKRSQVKVFFHYDVTSDELQEQLYEELSHRIQKQLITLQNPSDCGPSRKKVLCNLTFRDPKVCGFGCSMVHIVYCLIVALATNRTMLLDDEKFIYTGPMGLKRFFQPLFSPQCDARRLRFIGKNDIVCMAEGKIVSAECKFLPNLKLQWPQWKPRVERVNFLPRRMPSYLAVLRNYHPQPLVWWAGQLFGYIMRYNNDTEMWLHQYELMLNFTECTGPVVGVQVRRTDKITMREAESFDLERYIELVDRYFESRRQDLGGSSKCIYLASDDPAVIREAEQRYGWRYKIKSNPMGAEISSNINSRLSSDGLKNGLIDLHFLSRSDHLVCTFSSGFCRLAYALINYQRPDTFKQVQADSLDEVYFFSRQDITNIKDNQIFVNFSKYSHTE